MKQYEGKTKLFIKYLGFLVEDYGMKFKFQTFADYKGFHGPIDTYSFYNDYGCFTFHNIVQRGEWGWYRSFKFSNNQYELLEREINQSEYLEKNYFFTSSWLKDLSNIIKISVKRCNSVFGISIKKTL